MMFILVINERRELWIGNNDNIASMSAVSAVRSAFAEKGEPAQDHWIELEMKLMADVALVGMSSVGKSSLIARIRQVASIASP